MVRQLVAKLRQKRKGIILINAVLASIIVGLVGIALASIYSGMFSTMSAGKAGSQGEQMASVESSVIKMKGYDESDSVTHDWKDMSDLVGEDGKQWESKVTLERTKTTDDGNTVKVMKVAVRKTGDLISRYSAEVPLVEGLDVYSKDEIDQMFTTLNSQISQLSSDLDAFKKETADNFTNIINNINQINANLDDLQKMINAETQARVDADKAISNSLSNETKARQDADAALSNQIDSLKSSLTDLQSALNTEISNRQAADKTLQGNIDSEAAARKAADTAEANARKEAINNLQAQINSKYEELYNLYKGLKSRLDGNEFVKSKDALNSIALKYEQKSGESTKSLHGYVDGVEVPLASQNTGSVSGTPNYNKQLSYSGGYIGKYGLTFYFFSVKEYGFAYVVGGWNESKGRNSEWNTSVYRMSTSDFEAHLHYVSRFDITNNLAKYAKRITVTSGALFFVEPGYVYVWCSQGSLPTVYAMN